MAFLTIQVLRRDARARGGLRVAESPASLGNPTAERDARRTRKVRLVFAPRSHGLRCVTSAGDASENKL